MLSILQSANIFVFGIKPNLILVGIIVLGALNKSWAEKSLLVLTSSAVLSINAPVDTGILVFSAAAFLTIFAAEKMPWTQFINLLVAISLSTIFMSLLNFDAIRAAIEMAYNIVFYMLVFLCLKDRLEDVQEIKFKRI